MAQLELFRTFVAVYRLGSLTQAAHVRYLTQPAVSHQLATLERAVGAPLFIRTSQGVKPTGKGRTLYNDVFESVDKLELVRQSMRLVQEDRPRTLHLGMAAEYFTRFALERLADLENNLVLSFGPPDALLPQLEEGILDAVLSTQKPSSNALQYHVLMPKPFLLVGSPSNVKPLPSDTPTPEIVRYLGQQAWVSYSLECPVTRRFWSQVLGSPFKVQRRLVAPDLQAVKRAVELGVGISILPEFLCIEDVNEGTLIEVWPARELIPAERWMLAHRVMDGEREDLREVIKRLKKSHLTVELPFAGVKT